MDHHSCQGLCVLHTTSDSILLVLQAVSEAAPGSFSIPFSMGQPWHSWVSLNLQIWRAGFGGMAGKDHGEESGLGRERPVLIPVKGDGAGAIEDGIERKSNHWVV